MMKLTGEITAAAPRIRRILKIFEPTTFPTAISSSFFLAATMDVTSSGRLVPKATMVSPIRVSESPAMRAILTAPSTTQSPPNLMATMPPAMNMRQSQIGRFLISASSFSSACISSFVLSVFRLAFMALFTISTRNSTKTERRIIPSILSSSQARPPLAKFQPRRPRTRSISAQIMEKGKSLFTVSFETSMGVNNAEMPSTTMRLKVFEPTAFEIASELLLLNEADTETASSGRLVPMATTVIPMMSAGTLSFFAREDDPSTKKSAPFTRRTKPTTRRRMAFKTSIYLSTSDR